MANKILDEKLANNNILKIAKENNSKPNITHVGRSSVLSRVQAFLPTLASANAALEERQRIEGTDCCDIENPSNTLGPVIEMNLSLFERDDESDEETSENESETSNCSCDEYDCNCIQKPVFQELSPENIKLPQQLQQKGQIKGSIRPLIEEMNPSTDLKENSFTE